MPKRCFTYEVFTERRRAARVNASNLVGYVCLDEQGREISEGYGFLTNLSRTGIQMKTFRPLESAEILLLMVGLDDRILQTRADVIYEDKAGQRRSVCGVRFLEPSSSRNDFVTRLIRAYHGRDKAMLGTGIRSVP